MRLVRTIVANKTFFNVLFFLLLVSGVLAYVRIPIDVYPNVPFNEVVVETYWPGATAKEVELLITQKLEDEILTAQDIVKIRSRSSRDRSSINVKLDENLDAQAFQNRIQDIRGAVDRVPDLPDEAEEPVVQALTSWEMFPLVQVVVTSGGASELGEAGADKIAAEKHEFQARQVARNLIPVLRNIDGVQKIVDSFRDPEIHVDVRCEELWQLGYTLEDVARRLTVLNRDYSAGQLDLSSAQLILSTKGGQDDPRRLEDLVLFERPDKSPIKLGDIATVTRGFEEAVLWNRYNGRPCQALGVVKEAAADSVTLVDVIRAEVERFRRNGDVPAGVEISVVVDLSQMIRNRIGVLRRNLLTGVVLVGLLLWMTMGVRNALLALLGIPFSVLCGFILFEPLGLSLNAISLFSLVLISGMVVDDAIVVLESIYQKIEGGLPLKQAVIKGTSDVISPVFSSTLTTVAAFLPMLMTEGIVGKYFSVIPKTVIITLVASLVECFFILPVHYLEFGPRQARSAKPRESQLILGLAARFARLNRWLIRRPLIVTTFGLLVVGSAAAVATRIPVYLFPSDFQFYFVTAKLPEGSTLEQSRRMTAFIERVIQPQIDSGEVEYCFSRAGMAFSNENIRIISPDIAQVTVFMHEDEIYPERPLETTRARIEEALKRPDAPEVRSLVIEAPQDGPPTGKPVQVRLQVDEYEKGEHLAQRIVEFLGTVPGVHSIEKDLQRGPLRVDLMIRPEARALDGIDEARVGQILQAANIGVKVGTFKDSQYGEAYDLKVMLSEADRRALKSLTAAPLRHPRTGVLLPLSQVAYLVDRSSYQSRPHFGGRRSVAVSADIVEGEATSSQVNALLKDWMDRSGVAAAAEGVRYGGEFEETNKAFESMERAFYIALMLIYLILATQFRSYVQPLVILITVPFAFVGVIYGLLSLGIPFTITSFIAVIGLAGVVVNDTIVLLATINRLHRREGLPVPEAIVEGVRLRFRPILMTSLTTIIGLLPMAIGIGGFSKIWSPFAATMSFGLTSALLLTLLVVPSLVKLVDDLFGSSSAEEASSGSSEAMRAVVATPVR